MDSCSTYSSVLCVTRRKQRNRRAFRGLLAGILITGWPLAAHAVPAGPPGNAQAWNTYLQGLDALRDGRWADAVRELSAAEAQGINNPHLDLARGVAYALQEQFEPARTNVARGPRREGELWTYVIERMSGQYGRDHSFPVIRSMQAEYGQTAAPTGIPGHMIQGGDDYSTDYASFIYYEMADLYGQAREAGTLGSAPGLHDAMAEAGRWVANRIASHPEFALLHYQRGERLVGKGEYPAASAELTFAESAYPADIDVQFLNAECWRALGRPATARRLYTRVLTWRTDFAPAYIGRAWTAARLGDQRRVDSDLKVAARLDATQAETARASIEALAKKQIVAGDPEEVLTHLVSSASKGPAPEALLPQATQLHLAVEGRRKRYDEWYQDQLREKEDAIRAKPNDPAMQVALARFLVDESGNRFAEVEQQRGRVPLRWQPSAQAELTRAITACDAALSHDTRYVPALVVKAMALLEQNRGQEAQRLVDQALDISGFDDPEALVLYAQFKFKQAGISQMQAMGLRTPTYTTSSHTEWRGDGLWRVTTTYRHDPSASDLAQADALMRQAATMLREAELAMQKAVQATRGTLEGLLIESEYEFWYHSRQRAGALLLQAVQQYPDSLKARDQLAQYYRWMGQYDNRVEADLAALNMVQTSAAPLLERLWRNIDQSGWRYSRDTLEQALSIDPTDARCAYYQAAAYKSQGQPAQAQAYYCVAIALEEARLQLDEPSSDGVKLLARPAGDFALLLGARLELASLMATEHPREALALLKANTAIADRMGPGGLAEPMLSAMYPDPEAPKIPVPAPKNAANLLATSYLRAGKLLVSLGRTDEATQEYTVAAGYGRKLQGMIPNIGNAQGDTNFAHYAGAPAAEAQIELARNLIRDQEWDRAYEMLQDATQNSPTDEARRDLNQLFDQVVKVQDQRRQEQAAQEYARQRQEMQAQFEEQRRAAEERAQLQRSGAPVDPQLVGNWETSPEDMPFGATGAVQFSVRADGTYTWTEGGRTTTGTIQGWNTRVTLTANGSTPRSGAYRYLPGVSYGPGAGGTEEKLQLAFFDGRQYFLRKAR